MCAHVLRSLVVLPPKDLHAIGAESWHGTERRTHRAVSQADVATVVVQPQHLATRSGERRHAARVAVARRAALAAVLGYLRSLPAANVAATDGMAASGFALQA